MTRDYRWVSRGNTGLDSEVQRKKNDKVTGKESQ